MKNILEYLEKSAATFPEKIIFADETSSITYRDFLNSAKKIGSAIQKHVRKENQGIVVYIDRSINSLKAFFGIIYSGNFYVPVDKELPEKRKLLIKETLKPVMEISVSNDNRDAIEITELENENNDDQLLNNIRNQHIDTNPLYCIFTSGSTGIPKGVLVSHRSVINLCEEFSNTFFFNDNCIFGNQAPFDFDVSVKDIYSTIKHGGTMHIIPKRLFKIPIQLVSFLNERKINTVIWAASALIIIANFDTFSKEKPKYLHQVMFSGEVMPNKILNYWRRYLPEIQYVNLYGPTEITCNCTYYIVDRTFNDEEDLPIGHAFSNTDVFLLDDNNELITMQEKIGEVCVRGSCLALGYYNNIEKTKELFIQNPMNKSYPEFVYKTGDLAKYNNKQELIFVSRKDFQIKHMGHRIELGEIEIFVNSMNFIDYAVCLYDSKNEQIVLFYQAKQDYRKEIVKGLSETFPKYMWPNKYCLYEQLPMNAHAKIDRKKLSESFNG